MQSELIGNLKAYLPKLNEILSMSFKTHNVIIICTILSTIEQQTIILHI